MRKMSAVVSACLLFTLFAGCGGQKKESPQQITPPSQPEAANQESAPQDFVAVDKEPSVLKKVEPAYPELAKRAGMEGKVWVKIWVDTAGKPRQVTILKSDADIFNQPTIEAAKQFLFTPAYMNGKPISVWVSVPFKFALAEKQAARADTSGGPASRKEVNFLEGYIAAKEEAVVSMEKEAVAAQKSGKPDPVLMQKIQKGKAEIEALRRALRAMKQAQ